MKRVVAHRKLIDIEPSEFATLSAAADATISTGFGPQEHINPIDQGKDIRLDVHCTDEEGNHFIVEVQLSEQSTFYERAVFNSSFVIQEQLPSGGTDWAFAHNKGLKEGLEQGLEQGRQALMETAKIRLK